MDYIIDHSGSKLIIVDHQSAHLVKGTSLPTIICRDTGRADDPYEQFLGTHHTPPLRINDLLDIHQRGVDDLAENVDGKDLIWKWTKMQMLVYATRTWCLFLHLPDFEIEKCIQFRDNRPSK